jgi:hypothetical protein
MSGRQDFFADLARTVHVSQWQLALFLAAAATECVAFRNRRQQPWWSWMLALLHSKTHGSTWLFLNALFAQTILLKAFRSGTS